MAAHKNSISKFNFNKIILKQNIIRFVIIC